MSILQWTSKDSSSSKVFARRQIPKIQNGDEKKEQRNPMKETYIKQFAEINPNNPVLIEGLPGLGLVGKIAIRYLIKQLKPQKIANG